MHVAHWAVRTAKLAKALVVVRTILLSSVTGRSLVPVDTLLAFETVALLLEIATNGHFIRIVDMQVLAVLTSLALSLEPMNTDYLLVL